MVSTTSRDMVFHEDAAALSPPDAARVAQAISPCDGSLHVTFLNILQLDARQATRSERSRELELVRPSRLTVEWARALHSQSRSSPGSQVDVPGSAATGLSFRHARVQRKRICVGVSRWPAARGRPAQIGLDPARVRLRSPLVAENSRFAGHLTSATGDALEQLDPLPPDDSRVLTQAVTAARPASAPLVICS